MRKSSLEVSELRKQVPCRYESVQGMKCHDLAGKVLTVTSFLDNPEQVLRGSNPLCEKHIQQTIGNYRREWERHPEYFTD